MSEKSLYTSNSRDRLHALMKRGAEEPSSSQIWTEPVRPDSLLRKGLRRPGPPRVDTYPLGTQLRVAIEPPRRGHLLLLNEDTTRTFYCLCPSWFAPKEVYIQPPDFAYLPTEDSPYASFEANDGLGSEYLLAIITDKPLGLEWMPSDETIPALVLGEPEIDLLLKKLDALGDSHWTSLSSSFEIIP